LFIIVYLYTIGAQTINLNDFKNNNIRKTIDLYDDDGKTQAELNIECIFETEGIFCSFFLFYVYIFIIINFFIYINFKKKKNKNRIKI
jgi:hypothetical protein